MAGDSNYPYTALSLHCDGENNSTTFTDTSITQKVVTANGNAKVSTTWSKFSGSSAYFDGTGDYLSVPHHADFNLGSENLTIRAFIYLTGYASNNNGYYSSTIMARDTTTIRSFALRIYGTSNSYTSISFMGFSNNATYTIIESNYTFLLNTEYHIEAVRSGNLVYLFVNGTLLNTGGTAFSVTMQDSTTDLVVGATNYDATYKYEFVGYMDDIQLYKGVALHTASFTPPTSTFIDGLGQLTGNVTEGSYSYISKWLVKAWKSFSDTVSKEQVVTGATYTVDLPTLDLYVLACAPYIDGKWESGKTVTAGQFIVPSNPETTPYLWEVTTGGDFSTVEATWNLSGTTTQGTAILTFVGALPNPSILGPKIPS